MDFDSDFMATCPMVENRVKAIFNGIMSAGLFVSYLPQFVKILRTKSCDGISLWSINLGCIGAVAAMSNIFLFEFRLLRCCYGPWTTSMCVENSLSLVQNVIGWMCIVTVFILYFVFPPVRQNGGQVQDRDPAGKLNEAKRGVASFLSFSKRAATTSNTLGTVLHLGFTFVGIVLSVILLATQSWDGANSLGNTMGIICLATTFIQFIPQIIETWMLKRVGSLSVTTNLMHSWGSFVVAYLQYLQPSTNWTTWVPYVATGTFQITIVLLCVYFMVKEWRAKRTRTRTEDGERDDDIVHLPHEESKSKSSESLP
ncbi:uncharacterized protein BJ171DRAFT_642959 [Polychytrium aggregatum]|uniref:uncharacterized protein n=1 Tax=Polychytrium aggregatum TaxID=110093 RepID=UPI0022FED8E1|nr:uncharacterized protein BJ171DRAFT_642959 [Polychytrium aggregatum]KAI9193052.1 hypothetical protein BJ171DRAFT_642959 [Polychytrium aggregatum]